MKSSIRILISLVLTAFFLWLFLRSFDLRSAADSLRQASPWLIAAAVALNLASYVVRAWRWRHLLAPMREGIGLYNLTSTTFIGFMVSFLVPMRLGEVVRPVLLARRERVPSSAALATIALERLFDAMTVMSFFLIFSLSAHGRAILAPPEGGVASQASILLRQGAYAALGVVAVFLPVVIFLVIFPKQVVDFLHRLNRGGPQTWLGKGILILESFLGGLGSIRRARELGAIIASSIVMWLMIDLSVWCGLLAFNLPLGFFDTFLLMVALTVGISVPTPGGVGAYEFFCQISLTDLWGVPPAVAGAVAITQHAITMLPPILIGLLFMWRDGVRAAEVRSLAQAAPPAPGAAGAPAPGGGS